MMPGWGKSQNSVFESLMSLVYSWENIAGRKWADAEAEKDLMGRKLIEHGAICYRNCASELRGALISLLSQSSATEGEDQR